MRRVNSTVAPAPFSTIEHFREAATARLVGVELELIRQAAPLFRTWFATTGKPESVATFDLISLPYPTRYGLFRAARTPAPFLTITNRLLVIRWLDADGRRRTLLFEPTDIELARNTPFFIDLVRRTPGLVQRMVAHEHGSVLAHLRHAGIEPADIDYLTFDHLHTQDVRRLIGTDLPQTDISARRPLAGWFPNAKLIVQRAEIDAMASLHPLQQAWYQPDTYAAIRRDRLLVVDGDVLVGPGIALLATPGHTGGNHSLVLNTDSGIWAASENVIATECLTPEHSRIPGLRQYAQRWPHEVVLNANTIEATAQQYNSCVKEKLIVDTSRRDPRFLQFLPSSELTASRLNPGTGPTFTHGGIRHGVAATR